MNDNQNTNEEQGDAYREYTAGPAVETTPSVVGGGVYVLPQQAYQFVQTQTQSKRAMSKESVERAERFKMNSRKSQDLLAAIKDSADKTANRIKNVSLTRRRPLNKKYAEEFREDSNAQHQKDIKIHIQRYQSHKQFDNNNSKKAENNNKRQSFKKTHPTPYKSQSTTGNNVKK